MKTISSWSHINNVYTGNVTGCQLMVQGSGGTVSNIDLGTGLGQPCLMIESCDALHIGDGQCSGGGPWISFAGATIASNSTTFTITQAGHGFQAGDYIYIPASTNSGYQQAWRIASTTSNTITVASTANLGSDTVTFGSLYCVGYFGGAGASGNVTESSCSNMIWNTAVAAPMGSCSVFLDGCSGGAVNLKGHMWLCDYGSTGVFAHGFASAAYDGVNSYLYSVITSNANTFTIATGSGNTNATALVNGVTYIVQSIGSTDFTTVGGQNTVGNVFTATGAASGSGVCANAATHSLHPNGWVHVTGGLYTGFWHIQSVTANTITVISGLNAGNATVQPVEGDILGSTVQGIQLDQVSIDGGKDAFGGIRIEGCLDVNVTDPQIALGGGAPTDGSIFNGVVVSDGGRSFPVVDINFTGGTITGTRQTAFSPTYTKNAFVIDGPYTNGVKTSGCLMVGTPTTFFSFANSATPNLANLDTDFFKGAAAIANIGASGQVITNNSQTSVSWDHVSWDPFAMWSSAAPTKLTVPSGAQLVRLTAKTHWGTNVTPVYLTVIQNGTVACGSLALAAQPNNAQATMSTGAIAVQPGDYFQMQVLQVSGSSQTLANSAETAFTLEVIK